MHLDRDSLRTSWEPETLIGIGDATFRGEPVPIDPRHVLRQAVDAWRAMGLEPQISFELEFYLMEPDGGGGWRPVSLPGHRVYGTGMSIDPTGCVDDMVTTALACGFPVESWGSEFDEAAYEVNIRYNDAIPAADDAFVFRLLVRELAARHGKLATFMGRPLNDRGGSGMHVNFSFRREDGSNAFHDPNDPEGLSTLARQSAAGVLAHHTGMAAIMGNHVNAFKRLQPDMLNGYWAIWGHDDRSVTVRVPPARGEGTRLEQRTADAAANPYLVGAAVLNAARFGVEDAMELGPPQTVGGEPDSDVCIPANLVGGARRAERRHAARRGARSRAGRGLHDLEARRVGALRRRRRGHGVDRGQRLGAPLLPAVLLRPGRPWIGRRSHIPPTRRSGRRAFPTRPSRGCARMSPCPSGRTSRVVAASGSWPATTTCGR